MYRSSTRRWLCVFVLCPAAALADGRAFKIKDYSGFISLQQNEQVAAICHHDGRQLMRIAINVDLQADEGGLWIFPVPGTAEQTTVDLADQFPRLAGIDVAGRFRQGLRGLMATSRMTQVYMCPLALWSMARVRELVGIHASVEKWGMRAAVVSAADTRGLADVIRTEHAGIAAEDLTPFAPYCGDDYVFIVVWLQSRADFLAAFPELSEQPRTRSTKERFPCVQVEFPTEVAFYPMRPTASYGDATVPVRVYVIGHVKPQVDPGMADALLTRHFEQPVTDDFPREYLAGTTTEHVPYTLIWATSPARRFTDDMRFEPGEVPGWEVARVLQPMVSPPLVGLSWLVVVGVLSYLSGGLVGLLLFRRWQRPALVGACNPLTILAVFLVLRRVNLVSGPSNLGPAHFTMRKAVFLGMFSVLFLLSTFALEWLLMLPLSDAT